MTLSLVSNSPFCLYLKILELIIENMRFLLHFTEFYKLSLTLKYQSLMLIATYSRINNVIMKKLVWVIMSKRSMSG